ncbi:MAG: toll/interleukin-1 receptor domain-containing protein [Candidatus Thorarchaeota archaeon]
MQIFISYTRRDPDSHSKKFGKTLAKFLENRGINVIFDEFSFRPGYALAEEMINAIYNSDKFLLIASPAAFDSKYVLSELKYARDRSIQLHPKSFIHVINITDNPSLDFLPADLKCFLCHTGFNKSLNRILYEIFLSIMEIPMGKLLSELLHYTPESNWVMIERYQILDILSIDGDTQFVAKHAVQNISDEPQKYSHQMNVWATGSTRKWKPRFKAELDTGEQLKVTMKSRSFRGKKTYTATVTFPKNIPPDEICIFKTIYNYPKAYNLIKGDIYTFDCEEKGYGYIRVDIFFPREVNSTIPIVKVRNFQKIVREEKMSPMGSNKFSFKIFGAKPGQTYLFSLFYKKEN